MLIRYAKDIPISRGTIQPRIVFNVDLIVSQHKALEKGLNFSTATKTILTLNLSHRK